MTSSERPVERSLESEIPGLVVGELTEVSDLRRCESLQRAVWGASETEVVPLNQLRAAQHAGGLVAGARLDGELVGFCYGFPAVRPDRAAPGVHSHMTAVTPRLQGRGVGRALKWYQRHWCLDRGLDWIEWTFDPLRAGNARFNLEHLGATAAEYLVDTYGPMKDALNTGLPSDRLMAHWELTARYLDFLEDGRLRTEPAEQVTVALDVDEDGRPTEPRLGLDEAVIGVAVPGSLGEPSAGGGHEALPWRLALRRTLLHYFEAGYIATRFVAGAYLLEPGDGHLDRRAGAQAGTGSHSD